MLSVYVDLTIKVELCTFLPHDIDTGRFYLVRSNLDVTHNKLHVTVNGVNIFKLNSNSISFTLECFCKVYNHTTLVLKKLALSHQRLAPYAVEGLDILMALGEMIPLGKCFRAVYSTHGKNAVADAFAEMVMVSRKTARY